MIKPLIGALGYALIRLGKHMVCWAYYVEQTPDHIRVGDSIVNYVERKDDGQCESLMHYVTKD